MNWAGAIETNHKVLARIVATLIAVLELKSGGAMARLPKPVYHAAFWVLRPLEAAVRRLIVIAARGLKVKLPPVRPMPKGLVIAGKGQGHHSFQLFDTRKRFGWVPNAPKSEPGNPMLEASPPSPLHRPAARPVPGPDGTVDASRLSRRLAALKRALESLPAQARRMARWKARRKRMQNPKFTSPLRPGNPPGYRKRGKEELDFVLKECHGLAWDALREDTS